MDPALYRAAMEGEVDVLRNSRDHLELQVTQKKNTILHVAALFGHIQCVNDILRICPSLLGRSNTKGETPLHIAAREGHTDIVQALVDSCMEKSEQEQQLESGFGGITEMLRMTNENEDTALHEAVRNRHLDVVILLIGKDPDFSYAPNKAEETPLYLAAEKGLDEFVSEILKTCTSPSYTGPGGRTALHAAVIFGSQRSTTKLLKQRQSLTKAADVYGWTPLHHAAFFGHAQMVRKMLELDISVAYLTTDGDDKNTAIHIAASRGHVRVMKVLLSSCPDCWEIDNSRGQNILHIAVDNKQDPVIAYVQKSSILSSLINQKDNDGNTPLHLLAASNRYLPGLIRHPRAETVTFNKQNFTPLDIASNETYRENGRNFFEALKSAGSTLGWRNAFRKDKGETMSMKKKDPIPAQDEKKIKKFRKMADTHDCSCARGDSKLHGWTRHARWLQWK